MVTSTARTVSVPKATTSKKRPLSIGSYLYLLPATLLVAGLFIYSAIFTVAISFMNWNGLMPMKFIGLTNYVGVFKDPVFIGSLVNTLIWVAATLILPVGLGLVMALGLQRSRLRSLYQNVFYLPFALSATTAGVIWSFLLSTHGFSAFFQAIGLHQLNIDWLNTPRLNTLAMIIAYTWQSMGTSMVLFLVGLHAIPNEPLEAARLDGASGFTLFRHVIFPLLRPITSVVTLMALVGSFKVFDQIWIMTQGGPFNSSSTIAVLMYQEAFAEQNYGLGAAIAVVLSIFVLALSWGYLKSTFKKEGF